MFSTRPLLLSVRPSVTKLANTIFWKRVNRFWCQLAEVVCGARAWKDDNDQLWERGEAWRRHRFWPRGSRFSSFCCSLSQANNLITLLPQPRRRLCDRCSSFFMSVSQSVTLSVCLSVIVLFCEQDNSRRRFRMSTKPGRHGQGVTL